MKFIKDTLNESNVFKLFKNKVYFTIQWFHFHLTYYICRRTHTVMFNINNRVYSEHMSYELRRKSDITSQKLITKECKRFN